MTSNLASATPRRRRLAKRIAAVAALALGATTLTVSLAGPASANPSFSLNAVGSDTTQDVMNYMADAAVGGTLFASYNATEPVTNLGRNTTPAAQKMPDQGRHACRSTGPTARAMA